VGLCSRYWFFYQKLDEFGQASKRDANGGNPSGSGSGIDRIVEWYKTLSFEESVCWAFDVTPVDLLVIYWSHTLEEIQMYVRLKLSWWQTRAFQDYQVFAIILQQAFGSDKNTGDEPKTKAEAESMLNRMFAR
jgi:hypothetical protein